MKCFLWCPRYRKRNETGKSTVLSLFQMVINNFLIELFKGYVNYVIIYVTADKGD